jgi:Holliday junction resolvase RusA-like endonuclease
MAKTYNKIIIDNIPPSDNLVYRKGNARNRFAMYLTVEGKAWKEEIALRTNKYTPIDKQVEVRIEITFPNRRRCDVQNRIKLTLDALQGNVYKDDSQVVDLRLIKKYKKGIKKTIIEWRESEN